MKPYQETVSRAMDAAKENGYDETDSEPMEVAYDLAQTEKELEHIDPANLDILCPAIVCWQDSQRKPRYCGQLLECLVGVRAGLTI